MAGYGFESDIYKNAAALLSQNQFPERVIDEPGRNDILEKRGTEYVLIGHTLKWCSELEAAFNEAVAIAENHKKEKDEYYNLGIEKGYIIPKKTTEDILAEQTQINNKLLEAIMALQGKIDKLENKVPEKIDEREVVDNGINGNGNKPAVRNKSASGAKSTE